MAGEWAIVAAAAVGGVVSPAVEWIRDRGRQRSEREARKVASVAERERELRAAIDAVLEAAGGLTSGAMVGDSDRMARLHAAMLRFAMLTEDHDLRWHALIYVTDQDRGDLSDWLTRFYGLRDEELKRSRRRE